MNPIPARFFRFIAVLCLFGAVDGRAQQPWTSANSPTTQTLWGICYGNNRFAAVGEGGAVVTSPDGQTWTSRPSDTTKWLLAAAWSPTLSLFVVVGDAGTILTSPDGIAWTSRTSGTAQRLNSIAWGGGIFLVVGENGIALTSPDAATWTTRATGDTGWLRGAAYGNGTFVVTGHDGTVLTTTDGGASFRRRGVMTRQHLDAAVFNGEEFYITGGEFALAHSKEGTFWEVITYINFDGRENGIVYNGLAWFGNALVAVGDRGRMRDDSGSPWDTGPLAADWRAVAASPVRVVAVGTGGAIASALYFNNGYGGVGIHASIGAASFPPYADPPVRLGDRVTLSPVIANRQTPQNPQWSHDGRPIPGATSAQLVVDLATLADGGVYRLDASTLNGPAYAEITLLPQPNLPQFGVVDTGFRAAVPRQPDVVLPLADGRLYVAATEVFFDVGGQLQHALARLNPDGSVDPSFKTGSGIGFEGTTLTSGPTNISKLFLQPDGRLVVCGTFETVNGAAWPRIVRFNPDGSVDQTFRPAAALRDGALINTPVVLTDGRWLTLTPSQDNAGNRALVVRRFTSDGAADAVFGQVTLASPVLAAVTSFGAESAPAAIDPKGRVFAVATFGGLSGPFSYISGTSILFRLSPDGTPDATFTPRLFDQIDTLQATTRGLAMQTQVSSDSRLGPRTFVLTTLRLDFEGRIDDSFHAPPGVSQDGNGARLFKALPDGSVLEVATFNWRGRRGIVRLAPDGAHDADYTAELDLGYYGAAIYDLIPAPDGQLYVSGDFEALNGVVQPHLARLIPDRHAGITHLSNLSVLGRAGTGPDTLIAGFVTTGGTTDVLARGAGPVLVEFGVVGPLADPQLGLFSGSTFIAGNDDWSTGPAELLAATATRLGAFPFPANSRDAALLATGPAGAYSLQLTGKNVATGTALAELYDASPQPAGATSPRIVNFSVRNFAGTGPDTLVAGFTIDGTNTRKLLIRAVGPGLVKFGLANALADPGLIVYRNTTPVATNDDWSVDMRPNTDIMGPTIEEASTSVGAFALDENSKDAAVVVSLAPGSYTVLVTGKNGTTGVALVEIYELP